MIDPPSRFRCLASVLASALLLLPSCDSARSADAAEEDPVEAECPEGMTRVDDYCVDTWEASIRDHSAFLVPRGGMAVALEGVVPQAYISGEVAAAVCEAAGKRLCTSTEWIRACKGPEGTLFPYGNTYRSNACNEGRIEHPVVELFGSAANWSSAQMNDPRLNQLPHSLDLTGANPECVTAEGIFDMHGNLHEWVAEADGTFRGGFYVDATINGRGCEYRTTAHGRDYHDYSTGFRCCADLD